MMPSRIDIEAAELRPQNRALFERAQRRGDTMAGADLDDVLNGCEIFEIYADGVLVAAYAVDQRECGGKRNVMCVAAAGAAGFDLTAVLGAALESHAGPGGRAEFFTRRGGLVEKAAAKHGYKVAGVLLRKDFD